MSHKLNEESEESYNNKEDNGGDDMTAFIHSTVPTKAKHNIERNILREIFEKILSFRHIHLEGYRGKYGKGNILEKYLQLKKEKYRKIIKRQKKTGTANERRKRSIKESAGYTHDSETCKKYNENLREMWKNLSKYISTSEASPPNKSVLHNIAVMIKAYLDHVSPIDFNGETPKTVVITKRKNNIFPYSIISEINTMDDSNNKPVNERQNYNSIHFSSYQTYKRRNNKFKNKAEKNIAF
ncbi:unnamed protein product [Parnassius mnemosyne]|uniref:Uncharacterized protein n=1 Tax=Parnassius mnemosyne TaxID=213953 RepID=A0AAV1LJ65_9NEOP